MDQAAVICLWAAAGTGLFMAVTGALMWHVQRNIDRDLRWAEWQGGEVTRLR